MERPGWSCVSSDQSCGRGSTQTQERFIRWDTKGNLTVTIISVIILGAAGFSFWARADSKDCVDSKNLTEYWKQMLMQVSSGAGLEKVSAIVTRY